MDLLLQMEQRNRESADVRRRRDGPTIIENVKRGRNLSNNIIRIII